MVAWGGAGAASTETSLVVPEKALSTISDKDELSDLVKTVVKQETKRADVARKEQTDALTQSLQRPSQDARRASLVSRN